MTANISPSQVSAYASGAVLGAVALLMVLAPHIRAEDFVPAHPAPACAARVSSDQAEALRADVVRAEARRDVLIGGGSAYAAAKAGFVQVADLKAADGAVTAARARFRSTCG